MKKIVLLCLSVILSSCATAGFTVHQASILTNASPEARSMETFVLLPAAEMPNPDSILSRRVMAMAAWTLESAGLSQVDHIDNADQVVFVLYGKSAPQTQTREVPVYGQTSPGTVHTSPGSTGGISSPSVTVVTPPEQGIVGTRTETTTFVQSYLNIVSVSPQSVIDGGWYPFWEAQSITADRVGDLDYVLPILFASIRDRVGTTTGQRQIVRVPESGEFIQTLRSIY